MDNWEQKTILMFLYNIILLFFWLACGILVLQPGIKPMPPALKCGVLTTGPPVVPLYNILEEKSMLKFENHSWR